MTSQTEWTSSLPEWFRGLRPDLAAELERGERLIFEVKAGLVRDADRVREQLASYTSGLVAASSSAVDASHFEDLRIYALGDRSTLKTLMKSIGRLDPSIRAAVGKVANPEYRRVEEAFGEAFKSLSASALEARIGAGAVDVTLPGRARPIGSRHLIEQIRVEVVDIFLGLGYKIAEGPEVELDYYNFTALNQPPDHPARSLQDTFYVRDLSGEQAVVEGESDVLLRTHTSPVQMRVMEGQEPPIYVLAPGKVYRRDVADPSHLPQFTQIEGLVVDEGITFGDLKGTLDHVCKAIFGPDRRTRFRPHFFPFTEPSAEVDVSCGICGGEGCRFCKGTGWLEILGCGMVDPNVFGYAGIDPERYSGFAFGMGVERIAALKYNIPDLRMLLEGDMRFLRQF